MQRDEFVKDSFPYILGKDQDGTLTPIKDVQDIVFSIVLEIDRVCRKNNIPYALAFGSTLGLYNYGGFIPWDDDADIVIDYFDLPRLMEAFEKDLSPDFEYICYEKDNRYSVIIPKMKVKKRFGYMQDKNWYVIPDRTKSYEGFFVDIAVLTGMKDAKTHRRLIAKSQRRVVGYYILDGMLRVDPKGLKKRIIKEEKGIAESYRNGPFVCQSTIVPFQNHKVNLYPRETIYPFKEYNFNGHMLYSFNDIKTFCIMRYGEKCLKQLKNGAFVDNYPSRKRNAQHIRRFHIPK